MSMIGAVNYSWDFDEDEYQEWLRDDMEGAQPTNENLMEYIEDNVTFEIEYLDNETLHHFDSDNLMFSELEDEFGENMANKMLQTCLKDGSGSFETCDLYEDEVVDLNDPDSVNAMAVKLLQHGEYYKDCRGFILTNGEVVYTPAEHNQCSIIDGVNGTFDFIRLGNIRVLSQSIDLSKMPTREQMLTLRKVIKSYADEVLYVDILGDGATLSSAVYVRPSIDRVLGEITRYFTEGIKLRGSQMWEQINFMFDKNIVISESQYNRLFNKNRKNIIISESQYKRLFENKRI